MIVRNFTTYAQLIFDSRTETFVSAELLARPIKGSNIDLETFFEHIDSASLTKWFVQQVHEASAFKKTTGLTAHVNLDRRTIDDCLESVIKSLNSIDNGSQVALELTQVQGLPEPALLSNFKKCLNFELNFALDDFYFNNTLPYEIGKYNFDIIKIDRAVVLEAQTNYCTQHKLKKLQETYPVTYIIEGVETNEQARMMQDLGFHLFQGFFYHKPQPITPVVDFLLSIH